MAVGDYSTTPGNNTSISGINIAEGCSPAGINNAIRQMMADIKTYTDALTTYDASAVAITGGTINGTAIGGSTPAAGAFTTLSSSGAATLASAVVSGNLTFGGTALTDITGADTKLVSGTAGTSGNLASWNVDGDLVDSTFAVVDEDDMASNSATKVPTQQSVKAYVDASGGGLQFISTVDLASDATADFVLTAGYDAYVFVLANVIPVNDQDVLWIRTSTDGGSTYDSGAGGYAYAGTAVTANAASAFNASLSDTKIVTTGAVGSDVGEDGISGQVWVNGPHLSKKTQIDWRLGYLTPVPGTTFFGLSVGSGQRQSSADVDAIRFLFSTGSLESGTITLWGMKNA